MFYILLGLSAKLYPYLRIMFVVFHSDKKIMKKKLMILFNVSFYLLLWSNIYVWQISTWV